MALAVQTVIGVNGPGTVQNVSPGATGVAVTSGNCVVGAVAYFNAGVAFTDYLSNVTDDKGSSSYTFLDHLSDAAGIRWLTTFYRFGIVTGPATLTANFSATLVSDTQVFWLEYHGFDGIVGHGGQAQSVPGTATNAITSGSVNTGTSPVVGININRLATLTTAVGTGFTLEKQDTITTSWGCTIGDLTGSGVSTAATFTDATNGSTAGQIYLTSVMALDNTGCRWSLRLGVGCSIGWRASLLAAGAWRAGKAIEKNGVVTRRSLILPSRRHNGGPPLDD